MKKIELLSQLWTFFFLILSKPDIFCLLLYIRGNKESRAMIFYFSSSLYLKNTWKTFWFVIHDAQVMYFIRCGKVNSIFYCSYSEHLLDIIITRWSTRFVFYWIVVTIAKQYLKYLIHYWVEKQQHQL